MLEVEVDELKDEMGDKYALDDIMHNIYNKQ